MSEWKTEKDFKCVIHRGIRKWQWYQWHTYAGWPWIGHVQTWLVVQQTAYMWQSLGKKAMHMDCSLICWYNSVLQSLTLFISGSDTIYCRFHGSMLDHVRWRCKINLGCMALTHEYGLMLICWSTWLVHIWISLIYLMIYYWKHMMDIMVHAFFMWLGYILRHVVGEIDEMIMLYIIDDL